jgi:anti-sigma regulatory factor (Ser/Thr protein kinase)
MPKFEVREAIDLYGPRQGAREVGERLGFSRGDCQELAIVVSELTSNILKYGVRGSIEIDALDTAPFGVGIVVVARDQGPPFYDLQLALRDGYDDRGPIDPATLLKRGGLGTGLGAVLRLTDAFELQVLAVGKAIQVVRYRKRPKRR